MRFRLGSGVRLRLGLLLTEPLGSCAICASSILRQEGAATRHEPPSSSESRTWDARYLVARVCQW